MLRLHHSGPTHFAEPTADMHVQPPSALTLTKYLPQFLHLRHLYEQSPVSEDVLIFQFVERTRPSTLFVIAVTANTQRLSFTRFFILLYCNQKRLSICFFILRLPSNKQSGSLCVYIVTKKKKIYKSCALSILRYSFGRTFQVAVFDPSVRNID